MRIVTLVVLVSVAVATLSASAQTYPSKPIRVIVPFTAGSGSDMLARMIAPKLLDAWGQQVIIDNRAGAGSTIGSQIVATATPDGHTFMVNSSAFAGAASIYPKLPYDTYKDFSPITLIAGNPLLLVVAPSLGVKSVKELIALARSQPGKITFGSSGIGSGTHYGAELFKVTAKFDAVHVPYKGVPEHITDTVSGRIHFSVPPILAAMPLVREGRLVALGVTSRERAPMLPDVPTVAEAGVPGYEYLGWWGVIAPAKTPRPILDKIGGEVRRIVDSPEFKERVAAMGGRARSCTPEEFEKLIRTEVETRTKVFKAAGAQVVG
jgi:tripartite-type tricarboxylate transporter receptor subunit TctC